MKKDLPSEEKNDSSIITRREALKRIAFIGVGVVVGSIFSVVAPRDAVAGYFVSGDYLDDGGYGVSGDYLDSGGYGVSGDYADSGGYGVSGDYADSYSDSYYYDNY